MNASAGGALHAGLAYEAARATEAAALAAFALIGRGDERAADEAAALAMQGALNAAELTGSVVVGEGERGDAPALYVGERVGMGRGPKLDVALDPLEGVTLAAKALPNAMSLAVLASSGGLRRVPGAYMEKIALGPGFPPGLVDLDRDPAETVEAVAAARGAPASEIRVCILDRPRHAEVIARIRAAGAQILLIPDGDVAGVIGTADPDRHAHLYIGQGGAPEGVLACAALKCLGGQFQGRLVFRSEDERAHARRLYGPEEDLGRKLGLEDLVPGEAVFAATGVTTGPLLEGVRREKDGSMSTHTLLMRSATGAVHEIRTRWRA